MDGMDRCRACGAIRPYHALHEGRCVPGCRREPPPPSYRCPTCGRVSYNPSDLANLYCGACHQFAPSPTSGSP